MITRFNAPKPTLKIKTHPQLQTDMGLNGNMADTEFIITKEIFLEAGVNLKTKYKYNQNKNQLT